MRSRPALLARLAVKPVSLHDVTLSQIDQASVAQLTDGGYARVTIQGLACDLRTFFSNAESNGWCRVGLAAGIRGPRIYSQDFIPAGASWDDVLKLLAQTAGDRVVDIRDRALLMLLAHYGLRAGEVRRLRLEDFDWHNERLRVARGKTLSVQTYPLARQVGDAVLRYLRQARPRSIHREVFLTIRPPFRPLGYSAVRRVGISALAGLGHFPSTLRLTHSAPCVCHASLGRRPFLKGDRRSLGTPQSGHDPHLCQGESRGLAASRRLRPGGLAMKPQQLIGRYIRYRQTLGDKFEGSAAVLRAFVRAVWRSERRWNL